MNGLRSRQTLGKVTRLTGVAAGLLLAGAAALAEDSSKNLAPGFNALPPAAKVLIAPPDIELFEISAGGVPEPRGDWTETAKHLLRAELDSRRGSLGVQTLDLDEGTADEFGEVLSLQAAVSQAIATHHFGGVPLPTKNGQLDWSYGDAMQPLEQRSGARYCLFIWVRDGYASASRQATIALTAILSLGHVILGGGVQSANASLVDLESGRVLWFNHIARGRGDLRETDSAAETVGELLKNFPAAK